MIDEATMAAVLKHGTVHQIGYCSCPCYDALAKVADAIGREDELRIRMALVSPEALAGLIRGAAMMADDEGDPG